MGNKGQADLRRGAMISASAIHGDGRDRKQLAASPDQRPDRPQCSYCEWYGNLEDQ